MYNDGGPELGEPSDSSDGSDIACVVSTVGERSTREQEVRDQGVPYRPLSPLLILIYKQTLLN